MPLRMILFKVLTWPVNNTYVWVESKAVFLSCSYEETTDVLISLVGVISFLPPRSLSSADIILLLRPTERLQLCRMTSFVRQRLSEKK